MSELTQKQKIEAAIRENPNARTLKTWVDYMDKEITYTLKKVTEDKHFRYVQGQLAILEELQDLLNKAV